MAAVFGMIANMCGLRSRRKSLPTEDRSTDNSTADNKTAETTTSRPRITPTSLSPPPSITPPTTAIHHTTNEPEDITTEKRLPPPPSATLGDNPPPALNNKRSPPPHIDKSSSLHTYMSKSASTRRKLSSSLSMMRLPRGKSVKLKENGVLGDHHHHHHHNHHQHHHFRHKEKKLKHEDSLWTKKILLGEKCRVPVEDGDTILYDENGNRISSFSSKTAQSSSIPFSRSYSSSIDQEVSTSWSQGEKLRKEEDKSPDQVSTSSQGGKSKVEDDKSSDDS